MAPTTTTTVTPNKSDFIRLQPATMSAAEIVEKAKAEGIELRPGLIYEVRRIAKAKKGAASKKRAMAAKATAPKPRSTASKTASPKKPIASKAAFVRQFPNLSPKEIVERAKAEGIRLDVGYVYNVRSSGKAAQGSKKPAAKKMPSRSVRPSASASNEEQVLKIVAAEVGLARAIEVLLAQRAQVHAVLRG
jgi:hypothetical protein